MNENREYMNRVLCPDCDSKLRYQKDTYGEQDTDCSHWECLNDECEARDGTYEEIDLYNKKVEAQFERRDNAVFTLTQELEYKYREPIESQTDKCIDFIF